MTLNYEEFLQKSIFPELEKGRPNWDKPHTESVVENIKVIIENSSDNLNLDKDVLIIAAYAHDWGYAGLFNAGKPLNLDDINKAKEIHMKIGAEKLTQLLLNDMFQFLSKERKQRAIHLVKIHDKLSMLKDIDELVLMEADTLGGLDVQKVKPSFDKNSNDRYMIGVKSKRFPLFVTDYGKQRFKKLYEIRKNFYLGIK